MFSNMFDANLYGKIMASQPSVIQNATLGYLVTGGQAVGAVMGASQAAMALTGSGGALAGPAAPGQAGQVSSLVGTGMGILNGANQIQSLMNGGASQLTAAKTRLTALTAQAVAQGLLVNPASGLVTLGPGAQSAISAAAPYGSAEVAAYYANQIALYNTQINLVLFQTRMSDLIIPASILATGLQVVGLFAKSSGSTAPATLTTEPRTDPTMPTTTQPPIVLTPVSPPINGVAIPKTGGTTLSSAGALGADVPPHAAGLSQAGLTPAALAGSGAAATAVVRGMPVIDESGAGASPMMGVGGGAAGTAGRSQQQRDGKNWSLFEDDDVAAETDADVDADGVLR